MLHTLFRSKRQICWKVEIFTIKDRRCHKKTIECACSFAYIGLICHQNFNFETFVDNSQPTVYWHLANDTNFTHADILKADGSCSNPQRNIKKSQLSVGSSQTDWDDIVDEPRIVCSSPVDLYLRLFWRRYNGSLSY